MTWQPKGPFTQAIFVAATMAMQFFCSRLQLQNRTCKPGTIFSAICRRAIGLLQQTVTWYKIRLTGGQAHYYSRAGTSKQRQVKLDWLWSLCFNVPVRE